MNRLWDVDVTGVHLVDSPANRRRFAVVKSAGGAADVQCPNDDCDYSGPMTDDSDCPDCGTSLKTSKGAHPMKTLKLADIQKALEGKTEDIDATAFLKSLGIELPTTKQPDPTPTKLDKSKLAPDVVAYLEAMEQAVTKAAGDVKQLTDARAAETATALRKRAEALQAHGFEIDIEKATEAQVSGFEQAWTQIGKQLEKVGIFKALGDPTQPVEASGTPLKDAVAKAVVEQLGREPLDKTEEIRTRMAIYKSHPGLQLAVLREERAQRAG